MTHVGKTLLISLLFVACRAYAAPRLVIEDNDFLGPGGSDIQSTIPLLADPGIKVLGFTVATGDAWCDEEASHLLRFLEIAGRTDIPVYKGAVYPLVQTPARMAAWERMYGTIPWKGAWNDSVKPDSIPHVDKPYLIPPSPAGAPTTKPADGSAVDFLIAQVHRYPHQITIFEAGPMTNLALAIRIDPAFASLAKELIFMGGMLDGNVQQVTENANVFTDFNFVFDPEAAHIVLTAPWPKIVSLGLVTNQTKMTPELVARLLEKRTPVTEYLARYAAHLPLWDEMAAAVAVDPTLVTKQIVALMDVDIDHGMYYGQAHVWPKETAPHQGEQPVTVVQAVDLPRFYAQFVHAAQVMSPAATH
jgi:inosine-uridine nucleoside N-ribohydrolase